VYYGVGYEGLIVYYTSMKYFATELWAGGKYKYNRLGQTS